MEKIFVVYVRDRLFLEGIVAGLTLIERAILSALIDGNADMVYIIPTNNIHKNEITKYLKHKKIAHKKIKIIDESTLIKDIPQKSEIFVIYNTILCYRKDFISLINTVRDNTAIETDGKIMLAKIDNIEKIKIIPSLQKIKIKDNCHIISEEEGLEKAKKILFNKFLSYVRDVDTIITKYMNKYISVSVSFLLAKTSITPNIITTINLIIGIVASLILILEGTKAIPENRYLTAISGILFNLASIFDGCDGEVARLKYLESNFGVIYDSMVDDITNALFILALSIFLHKESIGIILVGIYILTKFFQILGAKRKKERDYVKYELTVLKSENKLSKIIQFASSLARNDFFSFLVMIFAILNRYDILFGGIIIYVSIFFIIVFTQYIRDVRGG